MGEINVAEFLVKKQTWIVAARAAAEAVSDSCDLGYDTIKWK